MTIKVTTAALGRRTPLLAIIILAWLCLWLMYWQHNAGGIAVAHHSRGAGPDFLMPNFLLILLMWWGMAIAMMLPTTLPAVDTLQQLTETALRKGEAAGHTRYFVAGFMLVWLGFGVVAAMLQYVLQQNLLLNTAAESVSPTLNAGLFLLAGLYQWSPWKQACASRCRSPMGFFLSRWQTGNDGYARMGRSMGWYCLGCCWAMMLLMFALGVMNLLWMGLLTLYMYAEKNWFQKPWLDRACGAVLIGIGLGLLIMN